MKKESVELFKKALEMDDLGDYHPQHPMMEHFDGDTTVLENGKAKYPQSEVSKKMDTRDGGNPAVRSIYPKGDPAETFANADALLKKMKLRKPKTYEGTDMEGRLYYEQPIAEQFDIVDGVMVPFNAKPKKHKKSTAKAEPILNITADVEEWTEEDIENFEMIPAYKARYKEQTEPESSVSSDRPYFEQIPTYTLKSPRIPELNVGKEVSDEEFRLVPSYIRKQKQDEPAI